MDTKVKGNEIDLGRPCNDKINSMFVMLIMPDGSKFGKTTKRLAISMAVERELDLVQVGLDGTDGSQIPVCKILDYNKMKYEEAKRKKAMHTSHKETKEMEISYNIADHDLSIKHRKISEFLAKKHKVIYSMKLRGREVTMGEEA